MDVGLYAGEDPSRFACSKLTGAPFYDRGRSKSGDRPAGAALERLPRLHRAGGRLLVHSKVRKEISSEIEKNDFVRIASNVVLGCLGVPPARPARP